MIVREIVPGVAMSAVILTHGSPLPLAQVGAPVLPAILARHVVLQALLLGIHVKPLFFAAFCKYSQLRRTSATLHACAKHPLAPYGASPSKISLIDPMHA